MGDAVRLQYDPDLPPTSSRMLVDELELEPDDLYAGEGFTAFSDLFQLYSAVDLPRLKDRPLPPHPVPAFEGAADVWSAIREGDVLVHHPYHAVRRGHPLRAARPRRIPRVLAIKMTLYRVSPTSPIAQALTRAAETGKEVAVLVELQARFDEEANIRWARALEEVGRSRRLRPDRLQDPLQGVPRGAPGGGRDPPLLPPRDGQLQRADRRHLRGLRPLHLPGVLRRGPDRALQPATGYTRPARFHHLLVAPTGCGRPSSSDPARGRARPGRARRRASWPR